MNIAGRDWSRVVPKVLWIRRKCPCCNSTDFKPAEMRPLDELLGMFALRPVRCKFCWRRYYWLSLHGASSA